MGPSRLEKTKQESRADMAIQGFLSAQGSQRHSSPAHSMTARSFGRASEEALPEADLVTWMSSSSKLSLELSGEFCTQHRCLLDSSMSGESCPITKQMETKVTTHCPQDWAQR